MIMYSRTKLTNEFHLASLLIMPCWSDYCQ